MSTKIIYICDHCKKELTYETYYKVKVEYQGIQYNRGWLPIGEVGICSDCRRNINLIPPSTAAAQSDPPPITLEDIIRDIATLAVQEEIANAAR